MKIYNGYEKIERAIAMQEARANQMVLADPTNKDDKVYKAIKASLDCWVYYAYSRGLPLDDSSENRQRRLASRSTKPKVVYRLVQDYHRDPDVVAEALYRAEGFCEKCKEKAPFIKSSNGEPYLEVHHIIPLSQGGLDSLERDCN